MRRGCYKHWRAKMGLATGLGALGLALVTSGCSFSRTDPKCANTDECRASFGTGYMCGNSGLCEVAEVEPNCLQQVPSDLLLSPQKYKDYIVLGSLMRTTGKEGARQDSAFLAIDAFNRFAERHEDEYPALLGLRFGFVQCDHEGDVEEAARLAEYLADVLRTPAIFGPSSSSAMIAAFSEVNLDEAGRELRRTLFISPSATSVALSDLESTTPGLLWRTAPTDDGQGRLMGQYAKDVDAPMIVLYEDTAYGKGLYTALRDSVGSLCDGCGFSFDASSSDIDSLAGTIASNRTINVLEDAETVFFIGAQEAHLKEMIRRMDDPSFEDKTLFFSDAAASSDTVELIDESDLMRVIGTRPKASTQGETLRVFTGIYEARYDESPLTHSFTTNAYDAAWMLLISALYPRALGREINPLSMAEGLTKLSDPDWTGRNERDCFGDYIDERCQPISLDAENVPDILSAFERFGRVDISGASGTLDYDGQSEELRDGAESFEYWHLKPPNEGSTNYLIASGTPTDESQN